MLFDEVNNDTQLYQVRKIYATSLPHIILYIPD